MVFYFLFFFSMFIHVKTELHGYANARLKKKILEAAFIIVERREIIDPRQNLYE